MKTKREYPATKFEAINPLLYDFTEVVLKFDDRFRIFKREERAKFTLQNKKKIKKKVFPIRAKSYLF